MGCCPSSEELHHDLPSSHPVQAERYLLSFKDVVYTIMASNPREVPDKHWAKVKRSWKNLLPTEEKVSDRRLTVLKHNKENVKRMMGRKTILMDTRLRNEPQTVAPFRPSVANGQLYSDPDFPFDVAMQGEERINDIQWKRPSVSSTALITFKTSNFM